MTKLTALLATTAIAFAGAAFAADKTEVKAETSLEHSKNGGYEKTTKVEKETPSGAVKQETKVELDVKDNGDATKTATTTSVNDPKGLMNKKTSKDVVKTKVEDGVTTTERTKKVDGKTVVDTKTETH